MEKTSLKKIEMDHNKLFLPALWPSKQTSDIRYANPINKIPFQYQGQNEMRNNFSIVQHRQESATYGDFLNVYYLFTQLYLIYCANK